MKGISAVGIASVSIILLVGSNIYWFINDFGQEYRYGVLHSSCTNSENSLNAKRNLIFQVAKDFKKQEILNYLGSLSKNKEITEYDGTVYTDYARFQFSGEELIDVN